MTASNKSSSPSSSSSSSGSERRRTRRRPILDTFSLFVTVPKKGVHRLTVHDVSESGIGFDFDTEGESLADFPIRAGDRIEVHFYLNQSLYLPLEANVMRVEDKGTVRRIGAEFPDKSSRHYKAFQTFVQLLDLLADVAEVQK